MIDILDAARIDVSSRLVVTLYDIDLILEGRVENPDNLADER
jgi:hypothetical protein